MLHLIELLGLPFLTCLTMIAILSYLGIHVLMREVIFIDIALAQIAVVGAITAHLAFAAHGDSALGYMCAFGLTLLASAFYSFVRKRIVQIPLEAIIGVSYAIAAAAAMFLVGVAPGGHIHVQQMLSGSILWTTWSDVIWCALVFSAVGFCFYLLRKPFKMISDNYEIAQREGIKVVWWDFLFYTLLGTVITLAVRIGGVVLVFAFLIIPAAISALFSSRWGVRLLIAWAIGGIATIMGLLFAMYLDFSVGPAVALFLGIALIVGGLSRVVNMAFTIAIIVIIFAAFGVICFLSGPSETLKAAPEHALDFVSVETQGYSDSHYHHHFSEEDMISSDRLGEIKDVQKLERLFKNAPDAEIGSSIVCRVLELEPAVGVRLSLDFLSADPPLFFRQLVVDKLEDVADEATGFDVMKPFTVDVNKEAAAKLAAKYGLKVPHRDQ